MSIVGKSLAVPAPDSGFARVSYTHRVTEVYGIDGATPEAQEIAKSFWFCTPVSHVEVKVDTETALDGYGSFEVDVYIYPRLQLDDPAEDPYGRRHSLCGTSAAEFCDRYDIPYRTTDDLAL